MHHHGSARKLCLWDRSRQARLQGRPPATKRRRPFCPDQLRLARSAGRIEDAGRTRAAAQAFIEGSRRQRQRLRHRDFRTGMAKTKYLVGGMLRPIVKQISEACSKTRMSADILQLAPVCSFNAFEFAYPQIFAKDAFLLLDMGHLQSTVLIGSKKELVLVR